jgi:hypothetical protein
VQLGANVEAQWTTTAGGDGSVGGLGPRTTSQRNATSLLTDAPWPAPGALRFATAVRVQAVVAAQVAHPQPLHVQPQLRRRGVGSRVVGEGGGTLASRLRSAYRRSSRPRLRTHSRCTSSRSSAASPCHPASRNLDRWRPYPPACPHRTHSK